MRFAQFVATPVSLAIAARLVGGDSSQLLALRNRKITEYCLDTYAKLVWLPADEKFAVWSYACDGSDGRRAVEAVS